MLAAKACMSLDQNRKSAGCDADFKLLTAADADLGLTIVVRVLSPKSDICGSTEVILDAKVFKDDKAAVLASKKRRVWEPFLRSDATRVVPSCKLHFLSTMFEDYSSYDICRLLALNFWSLMWRSRLHSTDPKALLANECDRLDVSTGRFTVCH